MEVIMKSTKRLFLTFLLCILFPISFSSQALAKSILSFVVLSQYNADMKIGDELYLIPLTSNGKLPTWKSSSSAIASVNTYGKITAKKAGTVTITAKITGAEASCKVTVAPTKVTITSPKKSIERGETLKLSATSSNGQKVTWKSSKKSIATIDEDGMVTAHKPGETAITATANKIQATYTLKVLSPTIQIDKSKISLYRGESIKLDVSTSSGYNPTYKTNKKTVAVVDSNGNITALKNGTATITATLDGVSKTCEITVKKPSITLQAETLHIKVGETFQNKAMVSSGNLPVWTSSNSNVLMVDDNGLITGLKKGKAYIYATEDGTKVKCSVTVTE